MPPPAPPGPAGSFRILIDTHLGSVGVVDRNGGAEAFADRVGYLCESHDRTREVVCCRLVDHRLPAVAGTAKPKPSGGLTPGTEHVDVR